MCAFTHNEYDAYICECNNKCQHSKMKLCPNDDEERFTRWDGGRASICCRKTNMDGMRKSVHENEQDKKSEIELEPTNARTHEQRMRKSSREKKKKERMAHKNASV